MRQNYEFLFYIQNYFQSFLSIYEKSILAYGVCIIIVIIYAEKTSPVPLRRGKIRKSALFCNFTKLNYSKSGSLLIL